MQIQSIYKHNFFSSHLCLSSFVIMTKCSRYFIFSWLNFRIAKHNFSVMGSIKQRSAYSNRSCHSELRHNVAVLYHAAQSPASLTSQLVDNVALTHRSSHCHKNSSSHCSTHMQLIHRQNRFMATVNTSKTCPVQTANTDKKEKVIVCKARFISETTFHYLLPPWKFWIILGKRHGNPSWNLNVVRSPLVVKELGEWESPRIIRNSAQFHFFYLLKIPSLTWLLASRVVGTKFH